MRIDWQRGKFTATLETQDFQADWRGFLAQVREQIPARHRDYIADRKAWVIKDRYAPLVEGLAREHLATAISPLPGSAGTASGVAPAAGPTEDGLLAPRPGDRSLHGALTGGPPDESRGEPAGIETSGAARALTIDGHATGELLSSALSPPEGGPFGAEPAHHTAAHKAAGHAEVAGSSSSVWPFFLLSLSFAAIGLWLAWRSLPAVKDYFMLELGAFPVFQSVFFAFASIAGIGCSLYAFGLLLRRRRRRLPEHDPSMT